MKAYLVTSKPPEPANAWWRFVEHRLPILLIYLMVATLVAVVLAPYMLVIRERFERKTVWEGIVHVYALEGLICKCGWTFIVHLVRGYPRRAAALEITV